MDAVFSFNDEGNVGDHDPLKRNAYQLSDYLKSDKDNNKESIEQGNDIHLFLHQKEEKNITSIKKKQETIENNINSDKYTLFVEEKETNIYDENNHYLVTIATIIKNEDIDFIKIIQKGNNSRQINKAHENNKVTTVFVVDLKENEDIQLK